MSVPPRLFVVTSTGSPHAVILRRGPARQVATLGWNRATNELTMGQWLKGRIYEFKCDLSPDGAHFIYFAGTGNPNTPSGGFWTAISRAPYLHAIYFAPQGADGTWFGGGAFTAPGRFWLNGGGPEPNGAELRRDPNKAAYPHSSDGFFGGDLHAARMAKRGWEVSGTGYKVILSKPVAAHWKLRWRVETHRKNRALVSGGYSFESIRGGAIELPDWDWADLWAGKLRYAAMGSLWSAKVHRDGSLAAVTLLHDLNGMAYEAIRAPYDRRLVRKE